MVLIAHLLIVVAQAPELMATHRPRLRHNGGCFDHIIIMVEFVFIIGVLDEAVDLDFDYRAELLFKLNVLSCHLGVVLISIIFHLVLKVVICCHGLERMSLL